MILIIFGSLVFLMGLALAAMGIWMTVSGVVQPKPWTLVSNESGRYSYVGFDGEVVEETYATKGEAEAACAKRKQWHADLNAGKFSEEMQRAEAEERARKKGFKPIAP